MRGLGLTEDFIGLPETRAGGPWSGISKLFFTAVHPEASAGLGPCVILFNYHHIPAMPSDQGTPPLKLRYPIGHSYLNGFLSYWRPTNPSPVGRDVSNC